MASKPRRPGASAAAIAMVALAAAASACTQSNVVLEPPPLVISTSDAHTCAISAGALYCWGKNDDGQLGIGNTDKQLSPVRVRPDADWLAVATGLSSSLALKVDGTMWSFGGNDKGQLGLGNSTPRATSPVRIGEQLAWVAIALRFRHACAVAQDRSLWCWGLNAEGQLGQNDVKNLSPEVIPELRQVTTERDFAMVDTGDGHTCAIKTDGTLWCWGRNSRSELGRPDIPDESRLPVQVGGATDWTVVRSGQNTTCGVRGRAAYCWGYSFGTDISVTIPGVPAETVVSMPTEIPGPPLVANLFFHTFGGAIIDDKGGAWFWGRNAEGQLGLGDMEDRPGVVGPDTSLWSQLSVGHFASCGVRAGRPVCAGKNDDGNLGQGNTLRQPGFTEVILGP